MTNLSSAAIAIAVAAMSVLAAASFADDMKTGTMATEPMKTDTMSADPMATDAMTANPMAADPMKADCIETATAETDAATRAAKLAECDAMIEARRLSPPRIAWVLL